MSHTGWRATGSRAQAAKLGIAKDLALDSAKDWSEEDMHRIEGYLLELKEQKIPYGLHAFGRGAAFGRGLRAGGHADDEDEAAVLDALLR